MSSSPYIFGIHDPGGEHLLAGRGWVLFTELVSEGGKDYRHYVNQGLGVIVRLNHAYGPTLPAPDRYGEFARQCASFVAGSQGCTTWIIGNEPNHHQEGRIPFDSYVDGFNQAANAIKRVQSDATVCIAAVAPWNMDAGDWLFYFAQLVRLCHCDGITLHTYTHGTDPALVHSDEKMQSHPDRYYHFKAYRDFMAAIPADKRHLPVYITETDQDEPWANVNSGWIQNAYGEINWWNQQPGNQQIRALIIYRWPNHDRWGFCDKAGVHDDLRAAIAKGYQWRDVSRETSATQWTGYVTAANGLNLRTEPHTTANVLTTVAMGEQVTVTARRGDWLAATYGALSGWVAAQWVSEQKPTINGGSTVDQRSDFDRAIEFVLRWEGGLANHGADPGGLTNYGISKASYPDLDIANLTKEQAIDIYRRDYWQRSGADKMAWPLCLVHLDSAVNAGVGKAQKWLAESGGDVMRYMALRLDFYTRLNTWPHFGLAWSRRVADLMKEATK